MGNPALKLFIRNILDDEPNHPTIDNGRRNEAGEPLQAENFPKEVWGVDDFKDNKPLPQLFFAYGPWVVSSAVAEIFRRFNMGKGGLFPVIIYKKDRKTPVDGDWYCLNFGNVKRAFVGVESSGVRPSWPGSTERWVPPFVLHDHDLAVTSEAYEGPDIWVDPAIRELFFLSDPLAQALKASGLGRSFSLKKCRVI